MGQFIFIIPYFLAIGLLVGVLSMVFGIGGGLVIVPALDLFLKYLGFSPDLSMKCAIATSLMTIMVSTLNVLYRQSKSGNVLWVMVSKFLPFVIAGGLVGSAITTIVSGLLLNYLFIIFLFYVTMHSMLKRDFKTPYKLEDFREPSLFSRGIVGFIIGNLSILMGIGGNILFVPYLRHYKLPMKNATAFTVAIMPLLALIGSIGYIIEGLHTTINMPPYSLGYVNLPALVLILLGSFLGAYIGQRLIARITDKIQARAYIGFLVIILILMLSSSNLFNMI
jgi:uncharacterized membrane protein YfcA